MVWPVQVSTDEAQGESTTVKRKRSVSGNSTQDQLRVQSLASSSSSSSAPKKKNTLKLLTRKEPAFTLGQLKAAVPPHCFVRSIPRSLMYLAIDLAEAVFALTMILYLDGITKDNLALNWACWIFYWAYQGVNWTGIWVIAHECGHGAFTPYEWLNDLIGFPLHTCLYVPYFSWKYSHSKHHHYTNNLTMDEPFVPRVVTTPAEKANALKQKRSFVSAVTNYVVYPVIMLLFGWPLYLAINASGPPKPRLTSHFDPSAHIFDKKNKTKIVLSDIGLVAWTLVLYKLVEIYGLGLMISLYLPPLLITNCFLVSITYLQHNHVDIPHYNNEEWTWLRGALCTVDRSLGSYLDYKTHHIVDTHVAHHVFSHLPFYHAQEASVHLAKRLGDYHMEEKRGFLHFAKSFFTTNGECVEVAGENGILWFLRHEVEQNNH